MAKFIEIRQGDECFCVNPDHITYFQRYQDTRTDINVVIWIYGKKYPVYSEMRYSELKKALER